MHFEQDSRHVGNMSEPSGILHVSEAIDLQDASKVH